MATTDLSPTQLRELCRALGWQGGSFFGVLAELKRLRAFEQAHKAMPEDAPLETSEAEARPWSPAP